MIQMISYIFQSLVSVWALLFLAILLKGSDD
jgi:hypothetical protein